MKPTQIFNILDLAVEARRKGKVFNPLFTGEAGLGKSEVTQQWVKKQRERNPEFSFVDLRIAYLEAPDMIGFPKEVLVDGVWRTLNCLPDFWPTKGEGLLLLEEPNRGTTGTTNTLMQVLTDRKVHKYTLPDGWIIAGCINPDSSEYDVNTMDVALRDRFEEFEIEYDHNSFVEYIEKNAWDERVVMFISSGIWQYKRPSDLAKGAKYTSPRTWSKIEAAEKAGARGNRTLHRIVTNSVLGKDIGNEYHKFCFDTSPVTAEEILKDKKNSLKKLEIQSNKDHYQGDLINATVESITKHYGGMKDKCKEDEIDEDTMAEIAVIIPADQAVNLIKACALKSNTGDISNYLKEFTKRHPKLIDVLKSNIRVERAIKK